MLHTWLYTFQRYFARILKTAVLSAYSALKWIHGFIPVQFNPLDLAICKNLVETEKRSPHPPVVKKEPVDLDMIKSIINNYASSDCNLKDLRFATMSTLLYEGLFRNRVSTLALIHY